MSKEKIKKILKFAKSLVGAKRCTGGEHIKLVRIKHLGGFLMINYLVLKKLKSKELIVAD